MPEMSLLILSEPEMAENERLWIQSLRSRHDPQYARVSPHFTLVFPVLSPATTAIVAHAKDVAGRTKKIKYQLRSALTVKDFQRPLTHVFLVPEEGFAAIVQLHDALYTGVLKFELRADIPFIPHITVGSFDDAQEAEQFADRLNADGVSAAGVLSAVDVVNYDQISLTRLARFSLD